MNVTWRVVGVITALAGVVWTLQGLGIVRLSGSPMTGEPIWVVIGPIVTGLGVLAFRYGGRRRNSAS